MEGESEIYRTRVSREVYVGGPRSHRYPNADIIVTNKRLILKWDYGDLEQYLLRDIRKVQSYFERRRFKKNATPEVWITLVTSRDGSPDIRLLTPEAAELVSEVQNAMISF